MEKPLKQKKFKSPKSPQCILPNKYEKLDKNGQLLKLSELEIKS